MNKKIWIIIILLFFLIDLILIYPSVLDKQVDVYDMDVYVTDTNENAFNLDKDKLHFGIMSNSSFSSYRDLVLNNPYDYSLKFKIWAEGDMAKNIVYEYEGSNYDSLNLILNPGETKTLKIIFNRNQLPIGFYEGQTFVSIRETFFLDNFLESFL